MAAQVPNIFVEQYDQGQKKIRADLMDENFAYVCQQLDANADTGSAAAAAAAAAQTTADGKANADLDDVTAAGKAVMAHAAMPSGQYIDLTLPADGGIVTAPADGIMFFRKAASAAGQFITLQKVSSNNILLEALNTSGGGYALAVFLPVSEGDTIRIYYNAAGVTTYFRFIYANGSAPTN